MPDQNNSCAVICAYNEEKTIGNIVEQTSQYVKDVIVVDDGSSDKTLYKAKRAGAIVLQHEKNKGKGAALKTGFDYFLKKKYDYAITLDADGQHIPHEIPLLIEKLEDGYDAIIGKRSFKSKHVPLSRKIGNKIDSKILSFLLSNEIHDAQSGFRLFTKKAVKAASDIKNNGFHYEIELLIRLIKKGHTIGWADISTVYESGRKSKIKPIKHIVESIKIYLRCLRNY